MIYECINLNNISILLFFNDERFKDKTIIDINNIKLGLFKLLL